MIEIVEICKLLKELIFNIKNKNEKDFMNHIDDIFDKTESILKNYFDMFSTIRINIISGKFNIDDVINYLLEREYELKDARILVRSFLKDKYYNNNETRVKFVAAIYGIMECYPVNNCTIIDKSNHTINSYIKFCQGLLLEDADIQRNKILNMTNGILQDLTTSWQTVCDCYRILKE